MRLLHFFFYPILYQKLTLVFVLLTHFQFMDFILHLPVVSSVIFYCYAKFHWFLSWRYKIVNAGAGRSHTVVVTEDGNSLAFGWNKHGQLGSGSVKNGMFWVICRIMHSVLMYFNGNYRLRGCSCNLWWSMLIWMQLSKVFKLMFGS